MKTIGNLITRVRRYYVAVRELSRLTDRELADLGIRRAEISRVAFETAQV
ncbi:MAG: DUF1127 domain-containing protein [Beijerinckiaceae bacterium]